MTKKRNSKLTHAECLERKRMAERKRKGRIRNDPVKLEELRRKERETEAAEVQYESNEVVKEAKYANYAENVFPNLLERLNAVVVQNNGHLAIGKLTWGDFVLAGMFDYLKNMLRMPDLEKKYPAFQKVIDNVYSSPKVKAYSESKN